MPLMTLAITIDEKGQIQVTGPIENKLLCYGLLEIAKDVVHEHCERISNQRVVPAGPADVAALRGLNGGKTL